MMDDKRLELRVSQEWLDALDEARGALSRSAFVKLAVSRPGLPKVVMDDDGAVRVTVPVTFSGEAPSKDETVAATKRIVERQREVASVRHAATCRCGVCKP